VGKLLKATSKRVKQTVFWSVVIVVLAACTVLHLALRSK
jgi:hypothetical protein